MIPRNINIQKTCQNFWDEVLDERRDFEKSEVYRKALAHIEDAKKERTYYSACSKLAEEHYLKLELRDITTKPTKPNSRRIMQHYSWDFAQQLHYPYEDQQV